MLNLPRIFRHCLLTSGCVLLSGFVPSGFSHPVSAAAQQQGPRIELPEPVFAFGSVAEGARVKHDFVVRNAGGSDLVIHQVVPACGCTAASPAQSIVKPGEQTTVHVEFDSTGFSGDKSKATRINTNDAESPSVFITLRGYIEPSLVVQPQRIMFGEIERSDDGSMPTRDLIIEARGNTTIAGVSSLSRQVTITERSSSPQRRELSVSLSPEVLNGELRERLVVDLAGEGGNRSINVPVMGMVRGSIQLKPAMLSFGILEGSALIERSARIENTSRGQLKILEVSSDNPAVEVTVRPVQAGKVSVLKVSVDPSKVQRDLRSSITITTDSRTQPTLVLGVYGILPPKGQPGIK